MTREEIIRLMVALSPPDFADAEVDEKALDHFMPLFQAIAASAAAKEREACCQIVYGYCGSDNVAARTVEAIKARGT